METETRPTIWIINEAGHPYHRALDLISDAELKPLTLGDINPLRTDRLNYHLAEGIGKYGKVEDYLLISGTPMVNAMAVLLWTLRFGEARILQWNAMRSKRCYELTTVVKEDLEHLLESFMLPK
ncbi:MAG TPA: hypothetical protein VFI96_06230 [Longimicrobiaceae bacterium]|nr:hypothetical protein [Longimicrobiaceae bacterium]